MLRNFYQHVICPRCRSCGHEGARISVFGLMLRYGPDYDIARVIAALRCSECDGRDVSFHFSTDMRWLGGGEWARWELGWNQECRPWPVVRVG